MTTITQDISDIAGADDNTSWTFYTQAIRESDSGDSIITTKKVRKYPVAGVLTVELDPGPAVVLAADGKHYPFTVPETDSELWTLIQAAVTIPPSTTHQQLVDAVDAWLASHTDVWASIPDKPAVIAAGSTKAEARDAIDVLSDAQVRRVRNVPDSNGVDDTAAVQAVLAEGAGEYVFRKNATPYIIDANPTTGMLEPLSNTRLIIEEGATVKVKTNALDLYTLLNLDGVQNVTIEGAGTLLGDAATHTGSTGQYGHLILITNGSADVRVVGPLLCKQAWGDGIYIGGGTVVNTDILIDGVIVDDCRREGIAPFFVDGCIIRNCTVRDISASAYHGPGNGIDCEPNDGQWVNDLTIENNTIERCYGSGIYAAPLPVSGTPYITNLVIRDNIVDNCSIGAAPLNDAGRDGIRVARLNGAVLKGNIVKDTGVGTVTDPTICHNILIGGAAGTACSNIVVEGGYLAGSTGMGIYVGNSPNTTIRGVDVYNNAAQGIYVDSSSHGAIVVGNDLLDNVQGNTGVGHVAVRHSSNNAVVAGNTFRGGNGLGWVVSDSGNDHLVARNVGIGPAPTNTLYSTGTTNLVSVGNVRKDTGVYEFWTATDKSDPAVVTHAATSKSTPVDADELPLIDSAASNVLKKLTWANIKATLETWLNTLTATWSNKTLTAPVLNGTSIMPQSATLAVHNQADQTTNYERARLFWSSDIFTIGTENGGTGTARQILIQGGGNGSISAFAATQNSAVGTVRLRANFSSPTGTIAGVNGTLAGSSGTQYGLSVSPTITQTSTAGVTVLLVNLTETSTGSGARLLADFQVGGTSKAKIDDTGVISAVASGAAGTVPVYAAVPATASSTGTAGQMARDASFVYFCTAANTWVRAALTTW